MKTTTTQTPIQKVARQLATLLVMATVPSAFGASQTWSNAPVDVNWPNTNNWVARAVPGVVNNTGNNAINNDVATFNSPIFSGIGGIGNPIITDDATVANGKARMLGSIVFDTANCGAYQFYSPSPKALNTGTTPETGTLCLCHNGGVIMLAAVTNSQVFTIPVGVRLPSSTDGIFNLSNNAALPTATLYMAHVFLDGATTRGTTFVLGGNNTGTNTIAFLSQSETVTTGVSGIRKQGAGTWILSGANNFRATSPFNIIDGTLIVRNASAFSLANTATVTNTGILQIDAVALVQPSLNLNRGGTIRMNGTESVNGVAVGAHAGTEVTLATTSASDVFTVGTALLATSVVSGGAADSVLHTAGPGTIVLATANTYVGNWSLDAATNRLSTSAFGAARDVKVSAGKILDTSLLGAYSLESVSLSANGTGTAVGSTAATITAGPAGTFDFGSKEIKLDFAPTSFTGDTAHPSLYVSEGSISLSGNFFTINNTSGTPLGVGTYRLIQQASGTVNVTGGPFAVVLGAGLAAGTIGDIQVSGGNVNLVVSTHAAAALNWQGGNPDNVWDSLTTANWNNGIGFAQFGNGDSVTFGPLGASFPSVSLPGTVLPSTVKVDTSANNYTITGSGQIAGPASLTKINSGTFVLQTANAYLGGTIVSNGTLRVGVANAIPSAGSGNVAVYGPGAIDLNGFNNTVNGLSGNGTVDNQAAATASVLTVGNNNASGSFSGAIQNSAGTLGVTKIGTGVLTLPVSNSYSGPTTISAGTVTTANARALGIGDLNVIGGTLNLQTDLWVTNLAGSGGTIANNSNTSTNKLIITGTNSTTFSGNVVNGSGGGGVGITLLGGELTMAGANTYTGGTFVGSGAGFFIPNSPAAVAGFIVASNGATVGLSGGSGTPGTPSSVTTVDGATVTFPSGAEGKIWQAQFIGGPTATNRFIGSVSAGQAMSFSNFLGVVVFANTNTANSNFRFFNGGGVSGGENTLFVFERVNVHTRDSQTVRLGAIIGGNTTAGIGDQAGTVSWEIGAKNTTTTFQGYIAGVNNSIVKVGTGSLTLDGRSYFTNQVTLPDTSVVDFPLFTNALSYLGSTTISNGTLKIVAPNNLTNSTNITLVGGVLDATQLGYSTNQTTLDINLVEQPTNTVAVTTATVEILAGQSLNGHGSILGNVTTDPAATVNVGLGIGTLSISGSIALNGTVNMDLNRSNPGQNSDRISAGSFAGSGATLNVTNAGPTLIGNTTFQLFNGAVSVFTTVNLPATDASGQIAYTWQNDLAVNGSIKLLTGLNPAPASITSVVNGSNLQLGWPLDHTGWTLQVQTNALTVGITGTWFDVAGSTATNQVIVPVNPANPTVFYRLTLPMP